MCIHSCGLRTLVALLLTLMNSPSRKANKRSLAKHLAGDFFLIDYDQQKNTPLLVGGVSLSLEVQALLDSLDAILGFLQAGLIVGSTLEVGILDLAIELDLRLGT